MSGFAKWKEISHSRAKYLPKDQYDLCQGQFLLVSTLHINIWQPGKLNFF